MDNISSEKKEGSLLLVDDDLSALQTMEAFLVREGYEVRCALDGHTALMFAHEDPPELVLLDVRLPDMDGFEVCQRLKEDQEARNIPVIFISGLGEVVDKVKGFSAGGVDYITKPFQVEEMLARVAVHLALRRLQRKVEAQNVQLEQEITNRKQAQETLQRAHDELEERVKQRTIDLAAANRQLVGSEKKLEERLRFEALISNLSSGFVNIPPDEVESQINKGLRSITEFFDADRCSIELFSDDGTQLARAFEYHSPEAEPAPEFLSKEQVPWYMDQLTRGNPVVMNRIEDFPPEAEKERQLCLAKGMKSLLSIPLLSEGKTLEACALVSTRAERAWPEELVKRFRLISEVFGNVLERERAEVEAFHARRELLRLDRLSRMGELTASLAHELNQPLTSILSNARAALRFIQSDRLDVGELKEILQDIASDDKRAGDIIRSLRSMLKPDEGVVERVQINDVLADVVSLFHSEAIIRNLTIEMDLADSLPPVYADKVQMQQVLVNLMMNAAQSMERGSSRKRKIILQSRPVGNHAVQVGVRDFGSGVEEKEIDKIFEPFFSTKRSGLGMGLSLSRSIIEAHGGHIWVENHKDQGATFSFDLPLTGSKQTSDPATKAVKR